MDTHTKRTTPNTQTTAPSDKGYHKKKDEVGLFTEEQTAIIDGVQERMDTAFSKFVIEKGWNNTRVLDEFSPYISGQSAASRILSGFQHVSIEMILVMVLRFGQPLDEILLGKKQTGYMLTPDDVSYFAALVKKASQCSDSKK